MIYTLFPRCLELNLMYIKVTRYAKLRERRRVIRNVNEGVEPRNLCIVPGQGFLHSRILVSRTFALNISSGTDDCSDLINF